VKARILIVGEDLALLETRALLLRDWETLTANSSQAKTNVEAQNFDLILLCHTVTEKNARALIQAAALSQSRPLILAISYPGKNSNLGVETHTLNFYESPAWLPTRVAGMMAERVPAS
jgi:DNA-binding response OmpR family regulator